MLRITALFVLVALSIQLVVSDDSSEPEVFEEVNKPHSLHLGKKINGEKLLDHQEIKGNRRYLRWVEYDYKFPSDDDDDTYKISRVIVQNKESDAKGGYPTLKSGGPGSDHVAIHIDSRWNKGFDFEVKVFGKKTHD